jgi:hypothetical protein
MYNGTHFDNTNFFNDGSLRLKYVANIESSGRIQFESPGNFFQFAEEKKSGLHPCKIKQT